MVKGKHKERECIRTNDVLGKEKHQAGSWRKSVLVAPDAKQHAQMHVSDFLVKHVSPDSDAASGSNFHSTGNSASGTS